MAYVLTIFIFFGWIPILSLGKAIAWVIEAIKGYKWECCGEMNEEESEGEEG